MKNAKQTGKDSLEKIEETIKTDAAPPRNTISGCCCGSGNQQEGDDIL